MDYSIRELRQNESKVLNTFFIRSNFYSRRGSYTTKRDYKSTRITGVC